MVNLFKGCTNLKTINNIPDSINTIFTQAFMDCHSLESIKLPSSLIKIEYQAFKNCKKLYKISLPKTLGTIENNTFIGCENLREVEFDGTASEFKDMFNRAITDYVRYLAKDGKFTIKCTDETITKGANEGRRTRLKPIVEYLKEN